mmetsp:Transcript_15620/g.46092  ORF Transcript_15620/g.46092 Transcript_15620/m.46092 type:complete len:262 (+) Transcript_15620:1282-2067(+)
MRCAAGTPVPPALPLALSFRGGTRGSAARWSVIRAADAPNASQWPVSRGIPTSAPTRGHTAAVAAGVAAAAGAATSVSTNPPPPCMRIALLGLVYTRALVAPGVGMEVWEKPRPLGVAGRPPAREMGGTSTLCSCDTTARISAPAADPGPPAVSDASNLSSQGGDEGRDGCARLTRGLSTPNLLHTQGLSTPNLLRIQGFPNAAGFPAARLDLSRTSRLAGEQRYASLRGLTDARLVLLRQRASGRRCQQQQERAALALRA